MTKEELIAEVNQNGGHVFAKTSGWWPMITWDVLAVPGGIFFLEDWIDPFASDKCVHELTGVERMLGPTMLEIVDGDYEMRLQPLAPGLDFEEAEIAQARAGHAKRLAEAGESDANYRKEHMRLRALRG